MLFEGHLLASNSNMESTIDSSSPKLIKSKLHALRKIFEIVRIFLCVQIFLYGFLELYGLFCMDIFLIVRIHFKISLATLFVPL